MISSKTEISVRSEWQEHLLRDTWWNIRLSSCTPGNEFFKFKLGSLAYWKPGAGDLGGKRRFPDPFVNPVWAQP